MDTSSVTRFFTPRGWGLVCAGTAALLGAVTLGRRDLLALAVLLIALPILAAALLRLFKPGFEVERSFSPPLVETGTAATVSLRVLSRGTPASEALIREGLPFRFGPSPVFRFPSGYAAENGSSTYEYRLRSSRRGLYGIGPVTADFVDPLGLARTVHTLGGTDRLAVAPAPLELPPSSLFSAMGTDGSAPSRRRGTPSEDDASTREYRHGDPMRRVHWPATARHGELMVRQEEPVTAPTASIVLDQRLASYDDGSPLNPDNGELLTSETFEWAVSAVVSSAVFFSESGYGVRFTDELSRPGLARSPSAVDSSETDFRGFDGVQNLAEGLAALGLESPPPPTPGNPTDAAAPFAALDVSGQAPGPLLVVAGRIDTAQAHTLAPAARYARQPLVLLVTDRPAALRPVLTILREAGWIAAAVTPATPVPAAWSLLDHDPQGVHAGGRV
ncbi:MULTISPECIES: DUF58 domain-containing protein [unclassified Arthrobacter]|uniref:DUF58 domain-containing protein n=1 Tax=unclassified Arthrobacter TaxID=235627 RepID=UPI0021025ED3|nr:MULTISPECIES: DUF58 domain-containing protein [unclassified Arthrobacter]MCQ1947818.1 DUF58 domain-containing protein [Arthrobacter sp. zg-Y1116]MCQ1996278.1 DUF58 domain-containing protein [Arthrobacter sp. zg-Y1171]UWX82673.1 DUF58 domain-containing protein [Arthrobacter sp. zg-Y1171]